MAQTLKFGKGTWATKKGSTLAYSDTNNSFKPLPFTYTGAGKGTRVNKEGLIEVVENDRPRIDYKDSEDGVFLLEKAATNLITYSEDFTKLTKTNTTITANQSISPNGTLNADELVGTGFARSIYAIGNGDITVSCYVKSNDGSNKDFIMGAGSLGSTGNSTFTATSEWQRFTHTFSTTAQSTDFGFFATGGTSLGLYLFGFQLEQNSVASSYIPTQGTIQTRVQETASGSGNSEVFNDSEGVLFADIKISDLSTSLAYPIAIYGNGSTIQIYYRPASQSITFLSSTGGIQYLFHSTINPLGNHKLSLVYKQGQYSAFIDGFLMNRQNSGNVPPNGTLNTLSIADSGSSNFYGKVKEIAYYDEVLTDLELETLTSYRTWEEMVKELNLNIIHNE